MSSKLGKKMSHTSKKGELSIDNIFENPKSSHVLDDSKQILFLCNNKKLLEGEVYHLPVDKSILGNEFSKS